MGKFGKYIRELPIDPRTIPMSRKCFEEAKPEIQMIVNQYRSAIDDIGRIAGVKFRSLHDIAEYIDNEKKRKQTNVLISGLVLLAYAVYVISRKVSQKANQRRRK